MGVPDGVSASKAQLEFQLAFSLYSLYASVSSPSGSATLKDSLRQSNCPLSAMSSYNSWINSYSAQTTPLEYIQVKNKDTSSNYLNIFMFII